jgi:outer membrane murein-binding lipoprotein Lpp
MDYSLMVAEMQKMSKTLELIPNMYTMISTLQTDVSGIKLEISTIKSDVSELKSDVSTLKSDVSTLKSDVSVLKSDVSTLKSDVSTLKSDVSTLKSDVSTLKSDVSTLKSDVSTLKSDVSTLKSDVSTLNSRVSVLENNFIYYTHQNTRIQEITNEETIFNYLTRKLPTSIFEKRGSFTFYNTHGQKITDFDGCILMNVRTPPRPLLQNDRMPHFLLKDDSTAISYTHVQKLTIIIESKRSLTIPKINKKIRQLLEIMQILNILDTINLATTNQKFLHMIREYQINEFPKNVILIFGSDDISSELKEFILEINSGTLNNTTYENYIYKAFKNDPFYSELLRDVNIPNQSKESLKQYISSRDTNAIRDSCRAGDYKHRSSKVLEYFQAYNSIQPLYRQVVGKLGVLFVNELIQPEFFPLTSTLELVGGGRYRSLKKRRAASKYIYKK